MSFAKERYDICEKCDRFIKLTKMCKECGCFMPAKVKFPQQHCPINKWGISTLPIEQKIHSFERI